MNLQQMTYYLITNFKNNRYNPPIRKMGQLHTTSFQPLVVHQCVIEISYPGYKSINSKSYDYLVQLKTPTGLWSVSHQDIMNDIFNSVQSNPNNATLIENLLSDISNSWENINLNKYNGISFPRFSLAEFVECICYISAQEEINYPRKYGFNGYKRPFYSYLEAVYSAIPNPVISYQMAVSRCNSNTKFAPYNAAIPYHII